jgi:Tfp pilus assembly protein PilN
MSQRPGPKPELSIEYSARGVAVYDPIARTTTDYSSLGSAGTVHGGKSVVLGLSRRSAFLRTVRVPNASIEDIRQVLMLRVADLFPLGPLELAVDFRLTDDINEEGRLAVVSAIPSPDLRRILGEARDAGFKVWGVLPVAFGSAAMARGLRQDNAAIVSRDQEGIGIDIVFHRELRHTRLVPPSSGIEAEVCRTYSLAGIPCGEIIASGGVVLSEPDLEVRDSPLSALIETFPEKLGLNLRPPEDILAEKQKGHSQKVRTSVLLCTAALALLAFVVLDRSDKANDVDIYRRKLQGKVNTLKKEQTQTESDAQTSITNWNTLKLAFQPAQKMGDVLAMVANRVPDGVWLTGLSLERGKPLVVRGTATSGDALAAYMQKLSHEPRLRDIHLVFANNGLIEQKNVQQFSLTAFPVGNLPLADPNSKKKNAPTKPKSSGATTP